MLVLGIETSCDETAAAVVRSGRHVLSSAVFSQVALHRPFGGVVPELASRSHVEALPRTVDEAMHQAGIAWNALDAVAVTFGPGLASALLVGVGAARGLAARLRKPLIAVNHIEAHIFSVFLSDEAPSFDAVCPFPALVVSGGHTLLVRVEGLARYTILGSTVDDAAGEAFDKGAKLLGLGFQGGPAIEHAAREGRRNAVAFPRGRASAGRHLPTGWRPELCFSFSGLKTALLYHVRDNPVANGSTAFADVTASYQEAIIDALIQRCRIAVQGQTCLAVAGGVSLNSRLRERLADLAAETGIRLLLAQPRYCADNAAMIAALAASGGGCRGEADMPMDVQPNLPLAWRQEPQHTAPS